MQALQLAVPSPKNPDLQKHALGSVLPGDESALSMHSSQLVPLPKNPDLQKHALGSVLPGGESALSMQASQLVLLPKKPASHRQKELPEDELELKGHALQLDAPASS